MSLFADPGMEEFIDEYYSSEERMIHYYPMLTYAISKGYRDIAIQMLNKGANPNEMPKLNYTSSLVEAVGLEDEELVECLIKNGADVNQITEQKISKFTTITNSPLCQAVNTNSKSNITKLLLDNEALPNVRLIEPMGYTAFVRAAAKGDFEKFKILLEYGADPHVKWSWTPNKEKTEINLFSCLNSFNNEERLEIAQILVDSQVDTNFHGSRVCPPVVRLALSLDPKLLEICFDAGVRINDFYKMEYKPKYCKTGYYDVKASGSIFSYYSTLPLPEVKEALDCCVKYNLNINELSWLKIANQISHVSPLTQAITNKNYALASYLIDLGADTEILAKHSPYAGYTPLIIAIRKGDEEGAIFLVQNGADPENSGKEKEHPLDLAKMYKMEKLVEELKKAIINKYS